MDFSAFTAAREVLQNSPLFVRTPMIKNCGHLFSGLNEQLNPKESASFCMKLEHMQNFGSFKIRGIINQFHHAPEKVKSGEQEMVTMSAGNYGFAFANACKKDSLKGTVVLPDSAPEVRSARIQSLGLVTERVPVARIVEQVELHKSMNKIYMHSFDDPRLFEGYGTVAMEIFEDAPDVEIIVVCCGGGGFLAGLSNAAKLISPSCRIYGVEPEGANCMYRSFQTGEAVSFPETKSIASGLSPPHAGKNSYAVCRKYVEEIILVTEEELKSAVSALFNRGLVVEPAGAAAFAAYINGKVPDTSGKHVAVVLTGRNTTPEELMTIIS